MHFTYVPKEFVHPTIIYNRKLQAAITLLVVLNYKFVSRTLVDENGCFEWTTGRLGEKPNL